MAISLAGKLFLLGLLCSNPTEKDKALDSKEQSKKLVPAAACIAHHMA